MSEELDFDSGFATPPTNQITWGKPGDVFRGTYTGSRSVPSKFGKGDTTIFDMIGDAGHYFAVDEDGKPVGDEIQVVKDEVYYVYTKNTFEDVIRKAKIGQKVLLRFIEMVKPKTGGKPYKLVQAKLGGMDDTYLSGGLNMKPDNDVPFLKS